MMPVRGMYPGEYLGMYVIPYTSKVNKTRRDFPLGISDLVKPPGVGNKPEKESRKGK